MELIQLRNFIEVAERGSFTHAATALGLNQPALSRQIRRLELELHKNLLYRHGRGVRLTDAGERFATTARNVLHQLDAASQIAPEADTGRITIGLPAPVARLLTVRVVRAFASHYPGVRIAVVEGSSINLRERLEAGEIDIALLHTSVGDTQAGWEDVRNEPLCVLAPRNGDTPTQPTITLAEVASLSLIFPGTPNPIRLIIENAAARAGFTLDVAQELDTIDTIMEMVQNGFGHAFATPIMILNTPFSRTLQLRRIVDPALHVKLTLASSERRTHDALHEKATTLLKHVVAQAMGAE